MLYLRAFVAVSHASTALNNKLNLFFNPSLHPTGAYPCLIAHSSLILYKDGVCGCQVEDAHSTSSRGDPVQQLHILHLEEGEKKTKSNSLILNTRTPTLMALKQLYTCVNCTEAQTHSDVADSSRRTLLPTWPKWNTPLNWAYMFA